jgi:alpha-L-rhamnosidase
MLSITGAFVKAVNLSCNRYAHPDNLDELPLFSWILPLEHQGMFQSAYQIIVSCKNTSKRTLVWDSGKQVGGESIFIPYKGTSLEPNSVYSWKVRFWDEQGKESDWSGEAEFETGLMQTGWKASWIGYDKAVGEPYDKSIPFYCADDFQKGENHYYLPPPPFLRYDFKVKGEPGRAKLFVAVLGLAYIEINGKRITKDRFITGLPDFQTTVYSRAFDVSECLSPGDNAIGIVLADGWYAGYIGLNAREWYGNKPRVLVQLEIETPNTEKQIICTGDDWKAAYGPLEYSDIFEGEGYNAVNEMPGWSGSGFNADSWDAVDTGTDQHYVPFPHIGVPIVEHKRLFPVKQIWISDDILQLDFGVNVVGVLSLRMSGSAGRRITINHAEMLGSAGRLYLYGNRSALAKDTYVFRGGEEEVFEPDFTYHGFRYAEISGVDGVKIISAEAVVFGSAVPDPTEFECTAPIVNNILEIVRNTQRGNFFEVPTDTCARDERLGWGMEGNHFLHAMCYLNNNYAFARKWARDIWDAQKENGSLEAVSPPMRMKDIDQYIGDLQSNNGIHCLYMLYRMYGDLASVEQYYEQAERYFGFLKNNSDRHIRIATTGDWLGIWEKTDHSDVQHGYGDCNPAIIGTSHYAIAVRMMIEMSRGIGRTEQAVCYETLLKEIIASFRQHFIQRDGTLRHAKQGDLLLALAAGFFSENEEKRAALILRRMLTEDGYVKWRGGTPSTPYFLATLKRLEMTDIANKFLTSMRYPSLGYMISTGSTSVWERWDSIHEDGSFHPMAMNAFNHLGFAVVGGYLVNGLAGIDSIEPGFRHFQICPGPSLEITGVKARYHSIYGDIVSNWSWESGKLTLRCRVPANTKATLKLPAESGTQAEFPDGGLIAMTRDGKYLTACVPPGEYTLRTQTVL